MTGLGRDRSTTRSGPVSPETGLRRVSVSDRSRPRPLHDRDISGLSSLHLAKTLWPSLWAVAVCRVPQVVRIVARLQSSSLCTLLVAGKRGSTGRHARLLAEVDKHTGKGCYMQSPAENLLAVESEATSKRTSTGMESRTPHLELDMAAAPGGARPFALVGDALATVGSATGAHSQVPPEGRSSKRR